jgi:hypothetical protein
MSNSAGAIGEFTRIGFALLLVHVARTIDFTVNGLPSWILPGQVPETIIVRGVHV